MLSNEERINQLFKKIAWLDKNRWKQQNDALINFSHQDFSNTDKILIHLLCYISDRRMGFQQIWDEGGYVYSDIVNEYKNKKGTIVLLNPDNSEGFIKKTPTGGYKFSSKSMVQKNNLLIEYGYSEGDKVDFIPRYYPSDIKSIMQTLIILEEYDKNIISYFASIIDKTEHMIIKKVAFALYLLTYYNIGQPKGTDYDKNYDKIINDIKENKKKVLEILHDNKLFEEKFKSFLKYVRFNQKRMWCSLRDYVKSDEFFPYTISGFKEIGRDDLAERWKNLDLSELELPGDVWNNNPKFQKCLFGNITGLNMNENSSKFIREVFEKYKHCITEGYPEMFDVTFNFVPRMCSEGMCDLCIFNEKNQIEQLCTKDTSKYCPVLLNSCGYINKCDIKTCILK